MGDNEEQVIVVEEEVPKVEPTIDEEKQSTAVATTTESQIVESNVSAPVMKSLGEVGVSDIKMQLDTTKSLEDQAADIAGAGATFGALQDESTREQLTDMKSEELLTKGQARVKKAKVEVKTEEQNLQKADYGIYEGIAEYSNIKKPLPRKMQIAVFSVLGFFQGILLVVFGIFFGCINILLDMVNGLAKRFAELTDHAKKISLSLLILFAVAMVVLVVLWLIDRYAGVQIF